MQEHIDNGKLKIVDNRDELLKEVNRIRAEGKKVVHFPTERKYQISKEEVDSILLAYNLSDDSDLLEIIGKRYDMMVHSWDIDKFVIGETINGGYLKLLHYYFSSIKENHNVYLAIEYFEQSLHRVIIRALLSDLARITNGVIITTYLEKNKLISGSNLYAF